MRIIHSEKYITDNFFFFYSPTPPHPQLPPQSKEKVEVLQKNETKVIYQGKLQKILNGVLLTC